MLVGGWYRELLQVWDVYVCGMESLLGLLGAEDNLEQQYSGNWKNLLERLGAAFVLFGFWRTRRW